VCTRRGANSGDFPKRIRAIVSEVIAPVAGFLEAWSANPNAQKPITMAVSVAFTRKPDVTTGCYFPTYTAEIGADGIGKGYLDRAILKRATHGVSEFFFCVGCKIYSFDLINAKALRCAFGKLASEAAAVDATSANGR
jgi:hypothetical protein